MNNYLIISILIISLMVFCFSFSYQLNGLFLLQKESATITKTENFFDNSYMANLNNLKQEDSVLTIIRVDN